MNVKQLRDESERLRLDAKTKRTQADRYTYNANDYDKAGDATRAEIERTEAAKLIDDAEAAERQADEHDQGAAIQETRAIDLDRRIASVKAEYEQQLKALESEKTSLLGGPGLFS